MTSVIALGTALTLILLASNLVDCEQFQEVNVEEDDKQSAFSADEKQPLAKRGVLQFARLIRRFTGKHALEYNGYGCWCGKGGRGKPLDATDRCCRAHDRCYDVLLRRKRCRRFQLYLKPYRYRRGKCYSRASPRWMGKSYRRCGVHLCICDVRAVICFRRHRRTFRKCYKNWPKNKCRK